MKAVKNIDWELFNKQRLILADLLDGGLFLENEEWEEADGPQCTICDKPMREGT